MPNTIRNSSTGYCHNTPPPPHPAPIKTPVGPRNDTKIGGKTISPNMVFSGRRMDSRGHDTSIITYCARGVGGQVLCVFAPDKRNGLCPSCGARLFFLRTDPQSAEDAAFRLEGDGKG